MAGNIICGGTCNTDTPPAFCFAVALGSSGAVGLGGKSCHDLNHDIDEFLFRSKDKLI